MKDYFRQTRTWTYSILAVLPLLLVYEFLIMVVNLGREMSVRVGADVWMKRLVSDLSGTWHVTIGLVLFVAGLIVFAVDRKKDVVIRPRYFGWMLLETVIYAIVLALAISATVGLLFANLWPIADAGGGFAKLGLGTQVALSLGAGLYEELVFRVILVGGLYYIIRRLTVSGPRPYIAAAFIGAIIFSTVHYIGPYADTFALASFVFRFLFGLALNALYLVRGFGVAAWTHAIYDLYVVSLLYTRAA